MSGCHDGAVRIGDVYGMLGRAFVDDGAVDARVGGGAARIGNERSV